jgi:hypothetical protein
VTKLVFLDTETTSLRHDRRAWEIAAIVRDPAQPEAGDVELSWFVAIDDLDLGNADLMSLKIGRYFDRHPDAVPLVDTNPFDDGPAREAYVLFDLERFLRGATLVGAVPNFDAEVLGNRMRAHGICPSWHYHLVDVETLAAGHRGFTPPWGFDDILAAYGLQYDETDRHTALGDARMARDLYDAVLGGREATE